MVKSNNEQWTDKLCHDFFFKTILYFYMWPKIHVSIYFLQVLKDDSLPQYLCDQCEQDVNKYFRKINDCNDVEKKWVEQLQNQNSSHPFLMVLKVVEVSCNAF